MQPVGNADIVTVKSLLETKYLLTMLFYKHYCCRFGSEEKIVLH